MQQQIKKQIKRQSKRQKNGTSQITKNCLRVYIYNT